MCTANIALLPGDAKRSYLIAARDHREVARNKVVLLDDYVTVPGTMVVLQVEPGGPTIPIALHRTDVSFNDALDEVDRLQRLRFRPDRLFRARDLVAVVDIARMLNRDISTVSGTYAPRPDFPQPYGKFGQTQLWDRQDIQTWWKHVYKHRKW